MALSLGVEYHKAFLKKLGQLDRLRTELPESAEPLVPKHWGELNTVTIAFGHGLSVAPLQAVMGISALVNGGKLIPPTFLKRDQAEADRLAKAEQQIKEFAEAKDQAGNPKFPHFEAVKSTMGALIQSASASRQVLSLEEAYNQAIWTRPDIREALTQAQQAEAARTAAEQRRSAVAKAQAARTPRTASTPMPPEDLSKLSTRELLEHQAKQLGVFED